MATARIFFARIDGGTVNLEGKDWDITISGGLGDEQFDPKEQSSGSNRYS
jgi:hypothetical protein